MVKSTRVLLRSRVSSLLNGSYLTFMTINYFCRHAFNGVIHREQQRKMYLLLTWNFLVIWHRYLVSSGVISVTISIMNSSTDIPFIPTQYHTCSSENLLIPDFAAAVTKLWWSQAIINGVILFYIFAGMVLISDIFMLSIEEITSQRRANGKKLWNDSVANLTLMALGSASHEIFLTLVETIGSGFESRELGTGSIIGSAAFNLMIVSAACVTSIRGGRSQKDQGVQGLRRDLVLLHLRLPVDVPRPHSHFPQRHWVMGGSPNFLLLPDHGTHGFRHWQELF